MIRTIEKLAHLSVMLIVFLFFFIVYVFVPVYDLKLALSIALIVGGFASAFILSRQLLGLLIIIFFFVMIVTWVITRTFTDPFFFSSVAVFLIVLFNLLKL